MKVTVQLRDGDHWLTFRCPGCHEDHEVRVSGHCTAEMRTWNWDKDRPAILGQVYVGWPVRCHYELSEGRIAFFPDSTHALAGQTVDLPDIE